MLKNLPYFCNMKTHVVFFIFQFQLLYFFPNECPGLCRQQTREKNQHQMKNEKKLYRFSYYKNMANFEAFHWNISSFINLLFLKSDISLIFDNQKVYDFPFSKESWIASKWQQLNKKWSNFLISISMKIKIVE